MDGQCRLAAGHLLSRAGTGTPGLGTAPFGFRGSDGGQWICIRRTPLAFGGVGNSGLVFSPAGLPGRAWPRRIRALARPHPEFSGRSRGSGGQTYSSGLVGGRRRRAGATAGTLDEATRESTGPDRTMRFGAFQSVPELAPVILSEEDVLHNE